MPHRARPVLFQVLSFDGASLTPDQIKAQGGNASLIHIDWMIGLDRVDIDGVCADGARVPVMRRQGVNGPEDASRAPVPQGRRAVIDHRQARQR